MYEYKQKESHNTFTPVRKTDLPFSTSKQWESGLMSAAAPVSVSGMSAYGAPLQRQSEESDKKKEEPLTDNERLIREAEDIEWLAIVKLSRTSKAEDVRRAQEILNRYGSQLTADGKFGENTKKALEFFQTSWTQLDLIQHGYSLVPDGIRGRETRRAQRHFEALRRDATKQELSDRDRYVKNLQDDATLGKPGLKDTLVRVAGIMLNSGYELAFVAGLLANIYHEGDAGKFEDFKLSSRKREYQKQVNTLINYTVKYSGKNITDVNIEDVQADLEILAANNWKGKFGLGSIQWTGTRTQQLLKHYMRVKGDSDKITREQVLEAETDFMLEEMMDVKQTYISIYPDWRNNNKKRLNSNDAAENAAQRVCLRYEIPDRALGKAADRGKTAVKIYKIMSAPAKPPVPTEVEAAVEPKGNTSGGPPVQKTAEP